MKGAFFPLAGLVGFLALSAAAADGPAAKEMEWKGKLRTGVVAIGGETTGIVLQTDKGTLELDLGNDKELRARAGKLNGKAVVVKGTLTVRKGVEVKERRIIRVRSLEAAEGGAKGADAGKETLLRVTDQDGSGPRQGRARPAAAGNEYVRVEIRGTVLVDRDAVRVTLAAVPPNFGPEARSWRLTFPGKPRLLAAAEKLGGRAVLVKGELRWVTGRVAKDGTIALDNRPFHPSPWEWVVFVRDLQAAETPIGN